MTEAVEHSEFRTVLADAGYDQQLIDHAVRLRIQMAANQPDGAARMVAKQDAYEEASSSFDASKYLARVADLDRPIDLSRDPMAAALLEPRPRPPSPPPPAAGAAPKPYPLRQPLSPKSKLQLADAYWANANAAVPQRFGATELSATPLTTIIPGRAWVTAAGRTHATVPTAVSVRLLRCPCGLAFVRGRPSNLTRQPMRGVLTRARVDPSAR